MAKKVYSTKKLKSVTRCPGWYLKMKGRMDSKRGKGVCDQYIEKLNERLGGIESIEVIRAENILHAARTEASVILSTYSDKQERLLSIPRNTEGSSAESIRIQRANVATLDGTRRDLMNSIERITTIHEEIVNTEIVLHERINKTRKKMNEKVATYVEGIRSGAMNSYEMPEIRLEDKALEIYWTKHRELDTKIQEMVKKAQGMGV